VTAILPENSGYEIVNRKDNKLGAGGVLIALRSDLISKLTNAIHYILGPSTEHLQKMTQMLSTNCMNQY
jgi:hypothetical protein